uniref:ANK_REP_REGION domain-containing protein n=1 Tax=Panagrellus redivivus TaxID=6233 RepID=A0A7E4UQ01_PANRE
MSEKLSDARDFGEFLRILDIPKPIENIDYDDFPLSDVAEMSKLQLMDSFAIDDTAASKIVDGITKLVKKKEPKKEAEQPKRRFKLFKTGTSKKKISFDDVFDDISDTPYHQGDQWTMDACAGAMSASSEEFDEIFDNLTKVSAPDVVANTVNEQGWTPLMYAAAMGRIHIAKVLIEEGANLKA